MPVAEVRLKAVSKEFGDVLAVKDVTLTVREGQFAVLVGPSGCGKTTTLRMIAGLEDVTRGEIHIGGVKVNDLPPRRRDVAMVFQHYSLYPHLRARDNLGFGLKVRRVPKAEIGKRVEEIADILHVSHLLDRRPAEMSGGERQRVAIGRALVRNPKVYLFDEPLSNLDAKLRLEMRSEIKRIHQRFQTTAVYVTHDQAEAMSMADRLAILDAGELRQEGGPLEVYQRPRDLFVARFLGSPPMNLIKGRVVVQDGEPCFVDESITCRLAEPIRGALSRGDLPPEDEFFLGIRPESIRLASHGAAGLCVDGELLVVEPLGAEVLLLVRVGEHEIRLKADARERVEPAEKVRLVFDAREVHLFHGPSGKAVPEADLDS